MTDLQVLAAFGLFLLALLAALLLARGTRQPAVAALPDGAIIVDGSNVLHWGGTPDLRVLTRAIRALEASGAAPIVVFDANVGHKLDRGYQGDRAMARLLNLPEARVHVVDKGVIADGVILDFAQDHQLEVVSNDRFRDWAQRYPFVKDHRRFRRGTWRDGNLQWQRAG